MNSSYSQCNLPRYIDIERKSLREFNPTAHAAQLFGSFYIVATQPTPNLMLHQIDQESKSAEPANPAHHQPPHRNLSLNSTKSHAYKSMCHQLRTGIFSDDYQSLNQPYPVNPVNPCSFNPRHCRC